MKKLTTAATLLAVTGGAAIAGGLDRSGQPIGIIFEKGNYAEVGFSQVMPEVSTTYSGGNVASDFTRIGGGLKTDLNDRVSFALIVDQPFGAAVAYPTTAPVPPLAGATGNIDSVALTALGRYKFNDNFSVHGGLRYVQLSADTNLGGGAYVADFAKDRALGYVIGGAYERPDIAMRVALTYSSEIEFTHAATVNGGPAGSINVTTPQSVNLDFQTGIAANTLLFGNIRWADWTETSVIAPGYPSNPLLSHANDSVSYTIGVGRKFSEKLSAAISLGFEEKRGGTASDIAPTNGQTDLSIGVTYAVSDTVKVSGGITYRKYNSTYTNTGALSSGNDLIGVGMKVGWNF